MSNGRALHLPACFLPDIFQYRKGISLIWNNFSLTGGWIYIVFLITGSTVPSALHSAIHKGIASRFLPVNEVLLSLIHKKFCYNLLPFNAFCNSLTPLKTLKTRNIFFVTVQAAFNFLKIVMLSPKNCTFNVIKARIQWVFHIFFSAYFTFCDE